VEDGSTSSRSKTDDSVERGSTDSRNASRSDDSVARGSTAPGDGVTVTVHLFDDGFAVEDDGPGVPETVRDRLFEGGFSTTEEGTGFGLSIVKRIADAHGWDVHVGESPSGGARFEVTGVARVDS
jgi:signal transduction histidine kinase